MSELESLASLPKVLNLGAGRKQSVNAFNVDLVASTTFYPTLLNKLVWRLANHWKEQYERRWAWMFPAWFLYFELEVIKASP